MVKKTLAFICVMLLIVGTLGCSSGPQYSSVDSGGSQKRDNGELTPLLGGLEGDVKPHWEKVEERDDVVGWDVSAGGGHAAVFCYLRPHAAGTFGLKNPVCDLYSLVLRELENPRVVAETATYKDIDVSGVPAVQLEEDVKEENSDAHDTMIYLCTTKGFVLLQCEVADDSKAEYDSIIRTFLSSIEVNQAEVLSYKAATSKAQRAESEGEIEARIRLYKSWVDDRLGNRGDDKGRDGEGTVNDDGNGSADDDSVDGRGGSKSASSGGDAANLPEVARNEADFDVSIIDCSADGITFKFTNPDNAYDCVVFPNYVTIGDNKYVFDESLHFRQDCKNVMVSMDLPRGASSEVFMSVDGVNDYTSLTLNVDDNTYNEKHNYANKSMDIVIASNGA